MKPLSFDLETCKEYIGDERCRILEAKARAWADSSIEPELPVLVEKMTYMEQVRAKMECVIMLETYKKRLERLKRMAENPQPYKKK